MTKTKVCFKCSEEKGLTEFYKHKAMSDGYLGKCKICTRLDVKARESILRKNPKFVESEKARQREKYHRLGYKGKHKPSPEDKKKAMDKYKSKYPEKVQAKNKCRHLKVKKEGNHLHHWSYNEEHFTDVIEVTVKLHNLVHRNMTYNQSKKMYISNYDGQLLDTKAKHMHFMRTCKFRNIHEF